ncbi:MAG: flagellar hook protein FlgE [Actinomycetales bacterium]
MLRSLFSSISGMRANQTMMDVVGNNIANVNTIGYKSSSAIFEDTLSQMLQGASAPQSRIGGSNPAQVGLGVRLAGITTSFTQGAAETTGRSTDLMLQGDGFFIVDKGSGDAYTRNGSFGFDAAGNLVNVDGGLIQGWTALNGNVDTKGPLSRITLPLGTTVPPVQTANASFVGNLPSDSAVGSVRTAKLDVYDDQGNARSLAATYTKVDATHWAVSLDDGVNAPVTGTLDFTGTPTGTQPAALTLNYGGVAVNLGNVTGYATMDTIAADTQDGQAAGTLQAFAIGRDGSLSGVFSNGVKEVLAQIAVATFNNPTGLTKDGDSTYGATINSGLAQVGTAGSGSRGVISAGVLEMSNVDLAQEFSNLIIAQRGFQANSRVITASDEILQDLVNIKR